MGGNHLQFSPSHIAALYGDMEMLQACSPAELNARDVNGKTAAHYCADAGSPWCLEWLVEKKCDTTSEAMLQDKKMHSPEELIYMNTRNEQKMIEWLELALKGEFPDKKRAEMEDYKLKKIQQENLDPIIQEFVDGADHKRMLKMYLWKIGDYQLPYPQPTDEEVRARLDLPTARVPRPPAKAKPPLPVCLMFPGTGSQYVGMLKDCMDLPGVQALLKEANKILGYDVKDLVLNGPKTKLDEPKFCQPAMFIAGMAGIEIMKAGDKQEEVERVQAVAGLNSGEYTAICAAGILSFGDTLRLVRARGEAIQKAAALRSQSTCSIAGLDRLMLDKCIKEAIASGVDKEPVCQIANLLFPGGFTVAGTKATIDQLCKIATKARALQARALPVGNGENTALMESAVKELSNAFDAAQAKMQPPRCSIYFNVTAKKVPAGSDPAGFSAMLKKQLTSEVLWDPTMKQMIMDGVKDFYEVGPLKQLKSMLKRIDRDAFKRTESVAV